MAKTKEFYTFKHVLNTLLKRIKSLLIPFLTLGCIWYVIEGEWRDHYWFLIVMWECIIVHLTIGCISSLFPKYTEHIESAVMSIIAIISLYVYGFLSRYNVFPILDFSRFHHLFPYYTIGIIATRYKLVERIMLKKSTYTIALSCFVVFTYLLTYKGYTLPLGKITNRIIPISALCIMTYWCNYADYAQSKMNKIFSNIGRHSLELYLIHPFFLFALFPIGEITRRLCEFGGYYNVVLVFITQVTSSIIASTIIIVCSYGIMWAVKKSPLLSQLFLGRKHS